MFISGPKAASCYWCHVNSRCDTDTVAVLCSGKLANSGTCMQRGCTAVFNSCRGTACTMHRTSPVQLVDRDDAATALQSSYKLAISSRSHELAAGRTAGGDYAHHGERMYVEGVLEQRRKAHAVRASCCF